MAEVIALSIAAPIALFLVICWVIRLIFMRLSGWGQLRGRYASRAPAAGWTSRGESASIGPIRFRRIVRAAATGEGLYLAVGGLAPLPAICIPWKDFVHVRWGEFYRRPVVELVTAAPSSVIRISPELFSRCRAWLPAPSDS